MKPFRYLAFCLVFFIAHQVVSQNDGMFKHKKERKRLWRKWNKKRDAYNPYLKKKGKNKPSAQAARQDKKELRRQKRAYKRSLKRAN